MSEALKEVQNNFVTSVTSKAGIAPTRAVQGFSEARANLVDIAKSMLAAVVPFADSVAGKAAFVAISKISAEGSWARFDTCEPCRQSR